MTGFGWVFDEDGLVELTHQEDGAMLSLINTEAIVFDSGESVFIGSSVAEGILGRIFQSFFERDATIAEWQLGNEALNTNISPDIILDWFQDRAGLNNLSDT